MSNEVQAVATITFYANKHVEVELSSIKGITPRTLEIAGNILHKTYRGLKAEFIRDEHIKAREVKVSADIDAAKADKEFHEKEDERLSEATDKVLASLRDIDKVDEDSSKDEEFEVFESDRLDKPEKVEV